MMAEYRPAVHYSPRALLTALLFLVCLIFFVDRGPYRAIRYSTTGDFSTVYAAARCWMHGSNPYDRESLKAELANAGAPPSLEHDQEINPSVYLPSAMPFVAVIAWLPWTAANLVWCLLSLALFGASIRKVLQHADLSPESKWLFGSAVLIFSPTYVGLYDGNPSVISISLIGLALCFARERSSVVSGVMLGVAICFKPQLGIAALCVLVFWECWRAIITSAFGFCAATILGGLVVSGGGRNWQWWRSEQQNLALSFLPGGQSDPAPGSQVAWQLLNGQTITSFAFGNRHASDVAVWIIAAALTMVFLYLRGKRKQNMPWLDVAFFAAVVLLITYHRYYDAQILVLLIPVLVELWRNKQRKTVALIGACLLVLAFPIQSFFARHLAFKAAAAGSLRHFVLLRNQPVAVLVITAALAFCA